MNQSAQYSAFIKQKATELGFTACGIAKAGFLEEEARHLDSWLRDGMHGKMNYMQNHYDLRLDPTRLVEGAKSVISLLYNYYPGPGRLADENELTISTYAWGEDYHFVLKDKLKLFLHEIRAHIGEVSGRVFVDSAPILERAWATRSGLGWIGKNSNLIRKGSGSFFFLCELIVDLELTYDGPVTDHCGSCTACIDACPTEAIVKPGTVNGSKCISYFTIELKEQIPQEMKGAWDNWIFGCDICQEVCPWNRFALTHQEPRFVNPELAGMKQADWIELTQEVFDKVFAKSAVKRTGYNGLMRNIVFLKTENRPQGKHHIQGNGE